MGGKFGRGLWEQWLWGVPAVIVRYLRLRLSKVPESLFVVLECVEQKGVYVLEKLFFV